MGNFQGRHALIFLAGPEHNYAYIRALLAKKPDSVIVCADGGLRHARALGLSPDLMISDCDSFAQLEGREMIRLTPEKDDTDSQICLRELMRRGCTDMTFVCATGGRIDHMLATLSLLEEACENGAHAEVIDAQNRILCYEGGRQIYENDPQYRFFSIIPLDAKLMGVTIENTKYTLQDAIVKRAGMITVSNEAIAPTLSVQIAHGRALIVFSRDAY